MPLRDHFRPPVYPRRTWEGFHGQWPAMMLQRLVPVLPEGYAAEPRVHLGKFFEIDVAGYGEDGAAPDQADGGPGGVATAPWVAPQPTTTIDVELGEQYEYEVLVYDAETGRELVAAVELVSPANKDRPEHRTAFVAKCAALLQKGVCVSIVDIVTVRRFNLYAELLALIDRADPALGAEPPATYAVTCRTRTTGRRSRLDAWAYPLDVGRPLPTLPLWLAEDVVVPLDLEASYEDTCRVLRVP